MTTVCPSCGVPNDGLLCHDDTTAFLGMLAAVPQLLDQLDVAISRQAKVGNGGKAGKGSAHERSPVNFGAMQVRDELVTEAAIWGCLDVPALRRDVNVGRGISRVGKAVKNAYRAIDRAQEREYLGVCYFEEDDLTCHAELWVRPGAKTVTCSQCEVTHDVAERRAWLLQRAADMLVTVKEASRYVGEIGHIRVTEASIRGYIHRKRLAYRVDTTLIRLGDLLELVVEESGRRSA